MGDDIGYGHMSGFGGPADTPVFDRLASKGLRFTNFHTTAVCAASRAALLTGRNAHSVGMGAIPEGSIGFPGYNAVIPRSAATVLEILRQNGYGTALVGKSHATPMHEITAAGPFDRWPGGLGAEYFYGFHGPGVSQWYPPLWENTTPVRAPRTPEGYHLEADMADKTIAFIQRQKSIHPNKPWIVYYAPSAHKPPVGVPREWITKYRGRFDDGYDQLRDRSWPASSSWGSSGPTPSCSPGRRPCRRGRSSATPTSRSGPAGWRCSAPRWSTPTIRSAASWRRSRRPGSWTTP
jgi:arylsulfatase A-like enzyme